MKTIGKYYRIDKKSIGFFKFIVEAYDGMAVVETIDRNQSLIILHVAPGCEADADDVLMALKNEIVIVPVEAPNRFSDEWTEMPS